MVYENGPFVFTPNTTELELNKYAWNQKANLLYITTPQGVIYYFIIYRLGLVLVIPRNWTTAPSQSTIFVPYSNSS